MDYIKIRFSDDFSQLSSKFEKTIDDMFRSMSPGFGIQGNRVARHCSAEATYRLAEIQYGNFERTIFLPAPIDPEIVSAAYNNGFLEIRLAKLPRDITHKIPISDG
jgi:HSP20 family protein